MIHIVNYKTTPIGLHGSTIHRCYAADDFYRWDGAPNLFTTGSSASDFAGDGSLWKTVTVPGGTWYTDRGVLVAVDGLVVYFDKYEDYVAQIQMRPSTFGDDVEDFGGLVFQYVDSNNYKYVGINENGLVSLVVVDEGTASVFYNGTTTMDLDAWHTVAVRVSNAAQYSIYVNGELEFQLSDSDVVTETWSGVISSGGTTYFARYALYSYSSEYSDWISINLTALPPSETVRSSRMSIPGRWGGVEQTGRPGGKTWSLSSTLIQNTTDPSSGQNVAVQPMGKAVTSRRRPGYKDALTVSNGDTTNSVYYNTKAITYTGDDTQYVVFNAVRGYGTDTGDRVYVKCDSDYSDIYVTDSNLNALNYYLKFATDFEAMVVVFKDDEDFTSGDTILVHFDGGADTVAHDVDTPFREFVDSTATIRGAWSMDEETPAGTIDERIASATISVHPESIYDKSPPLTTDFTYTKFTPSQASSYVRLTSDGTTDAHVADLAVSSSANVPLRITFNSDLSSDDFSVATLVVEDSTTSTATWNLYFNAQEITTYEIYLDTPDSGSVDETDITNIRLNFTSMAAAEYHVDVRTITWGKPPSIGAFSHRGTTFRFAKTVTATPTDGVGGSDVPIRINIANHNSTPCGGCDVCGIVTNYNWNDVIFTDGSYGVLDSYLESNTLTEATFIVWLPTLSTGGTVINVHYGGDSGLKFCDPVPTSDYGELSDKLISSYDMVRTPDDIIPLDTYAVLDDCSALTDWTVVSDEGDSLSIVDSYTGEGDAVRVSFVTGPARDVELILDTQTFDSDAVSMEWRLTTLSGVATGTVPATMRIEQGTAWAEWDADFQVNQDVLLSFTLASPDTSSGTIDYISAVDVSFTVTKKSGGSATMDIDMVSETMEVTPETEYEFINLFDVGNHGAVLEPQSSFPAIPEQPTPYNYTNPTLGRNIIVNSDGTGDYTTIAAAVAAASDGDVVEIVGEQIYSGVLILDKSVKIFGGTLTRTDSTAFNSGAIRISSGANVNLDINISNTNYAIEILRGTCFIDGGEYKGKIYGALGGAGYCVINDGIFSGRILPTYGPDDFLWVNGGIFSDNEIFYRAGTCIVNGGIFNNCVFKGDIDGVAEGKLFLVDGEFSNCELDALIADRGIIYVYPEIDMDNFDVSSTQPPRMIYIATTPGDVASDSVAGLGTSFDLSYGQKITTDITSGYPYFYNDTDGLQPCWPEVPEQPTPYTYDNPTLGRNIVVDSTGAGDYTAIADAVAAASNGDIIEIVGVQEYTGTLIINKKLKIIGDESAELKRIDADSGSYSVEITDQVELSVDITSTINRGLSVSGVAFVDCDISSTALGILIQGGGNLIFSGNLLNNHILITSTSGNRLWSYGAEYNVASPIRPQGGQVIIENTTYYHPTPTISILTGTSVAHILSYTASSPTINVDSSAFAYIYPDVTVPTITGDGTVYQADNPITVYDEVTGYEFSGPDGFTGIAQQLFVTDTALTDEQITAIEADFAKTPSDIDGSWVGRPWLFQGGNIPIYAMGTRFFGDTYGQYGSFTLSSSVNMVDTWIMGAFRILDGSEGRIMSFGNLEVDVSTSATTVSEGTYGTGTVSGDSIADGEVHTIGIMFKLNDSFDLYIDGTYVDSSSSAYSALYVADPFGFIGASSGGCDMSALYLMYGYGTMTASEFSSIDTQLKTYTALGSADGVASLIPSTGIRTNVEDFLRYWGGDLLYFNNVTQCFAGVLDNISYPQFDAGRNMKVANMTLSVLESNKNGVDE